MRLSLTRGARIATVPDPTVTRRSGARPLRTTSRLPSSPRSSANRPTYSPTSASNAVAIIRRAPFPRETIERDRDLALLPHREPANIHHGVPSCRPAPASVFSNREGTPPCSSGPSTTFGYSSIDAPEVQLLEALAGCPQRDQARANVLTGSWCTAPGSPDTSLGYR
jgi:hypothetical protein